MVLTSPSWLPCNGILPIVGQLEFPNFVMKFFFETPAIKPITLNMECRTFCFLVIR